MQTLRKKTSPLKYKNETSRFLGEGVSFKAKLIGILEVSEARGDRMCQEALSDLKMAIRAAGEHKQRITINIAIDGLRLRDEKTGDSLYHHPVHKISFIAQDMTDSRAFGYIFGSPDTGHRFFGIKTDKAASQVVIAMRDLFQVVFALKKKEIELAKQHLDKNRYGTSTIFSESAISGSKVTSVEPAGKTLADSKTVTATSSETKPEGPAVADLVDLELELNSLQQGITQMERITPSDPFGSKDDPFGDSFTSYPPKPILPPPPSGRERSNRASSESSSIFSPKTPHTSTSMEPGGAADTNLFNDDFRFSHEFNSSHEEPNSGDWFNDKIFEEPPLVPEPSKEQRQHEATKQEILSQFDVFTELDPLGTGKSKPYIDKKDFFQELKNPPKKVLNDLVSEKQPHEQKLFNANFEQHSTSQPTSGGSVFQVDPFSEDPFDKTDPFAETEFSRQDPFDTDNFSGAEFKVFNKDLKSADFSERFKFPPLENTDGLGLMLQNRMSKSPNKSPHTQINKQNSFDVSFAEKPLNKMPQQESCSLDMSSESECAPEPPPRPTSNLIQIKPPPLPPKKQPGDLGSKPPPRPPYSDDSHYDYMDNYETGPHSLDLNKKFDKSPPLPAPARKAKFDLTSTTTTVPERPKKPSDSQKDWWEEEDYLTPVSFPRQQKEPRSVAKHTGPILLPPPQRSLKKHHSVQHEQVTVSSFLETKPNVTTTNAQEKLNSLEGLDITLSQLTLSGLNDLASKLNIPPGQLSNMTLVQLTEYVSNFIKNKHANTDDSGTNVQFANFNADFANFNNFNEEPHDKYAVFRELLKEEIKQTKIDTEPEEHAEDRKKEEEEEEKLNNLDAKPTENTEDKTDRYAALREIVENEIKQIKEEKSIEENNINEADVVNEEESREATDMKNQANVVDTEKKLLSDKDDEVISPKDEVIEYGGQVDSKKEPVSPTPSKSPTNKPKSPVLNAVTEVIQTNNRLTSGSLSDIVSGSSPEIDNTGSTSEVVQKNQDATGESWAIFEQTKMSKQTVRDKHSEEGVSPWSSDSKEFGNGSPPEWGQRSGGGGGGGGGDSTGSGVDRWNRHHREQEGWWDTSAEPEAHYYPPSRRLTDSYEDEAYDYYDRPVRRRRQMAWSHGGQIAGGHSSSSRDASPWEEEPKRRDIREHKETWSSRHSKASFERRDRRHADSWDEEDDYEYDEEHSSRYHWPERHGSRESEKDRHGIWDRDAERWADDYADTRRHHRRREMDHERWCCPDWDVNAAEQPRYGGGRWRKHDEHYYPRDTQESPWDDDYANEPEEMHSRYVNTKRWKRPSSASEMDRKTGETKIRQGQYHGTGGSDGERDRRYKAGRRSRSRDSQYAESTMHGRYKTDPSLTSRGPHRPKKPPPPETEFTHDMPSKKPDTTKDLSNKRSATLGSRKKPKESPKTEEPVTVRTLPRRAATFENNFIPSETESPISVAGVSPRFTFENELETSEAESPVASKPLKGLRFDKPGRLKSSLRRDGRKATFKDDLKISPNSRTMQKSPFEDDFSPPIEKPETKPHENISTSSIKEENDGNEEEEEEDNNTFPSPSFDKHLARKKMLSKNRLSNNFGTDTSIKKSESVNIFARESDPFDDEFFSGRDGGGENHKHRITERNWTEDFGEYNFENQK